MTVQTEDVIAITENVLKTMLNFEVAAIDAAPLEGSGEQLASQIAINGAWKGTVTVESTLGLAREMAGGMLGLESNDVTEVDLNDALAEITNMVGGNIKSLLTSPSYLSLPTMASTTTTESSTADAKVLVQKTFICRDELLRITLHEQ